MARLVDEQTNATRLVNQKENNHMNSNQVYATLNADDQKAVDSLFKYPRLQRAMNAVYDTCFEPINRLMTYLERRNTQSFLDHCEKLIK